MGHSALRATDRRRRAAPDLIVVHASGHDAVELREGHAAIRRRHPRAVVFGCTAGGVIGGGREVEQERGLALVAAQLPQVEMRPFSLDPRGLDPDQLSPQRWTSRLGLGQAHQPSFLLLADPYSCDTERLIASLDAAYPGSPKVGGLASGARPPERSLLFGDTLHEVGLVGLALWGDLTVDAVVSQGARPLGAPMTVTRAERHLIAELDGAPALRAFEAFYGALSREDRLLLGRGPLVGIGVDPDKTQWRRGDFLVRDLLGADRERGVLGVGAPLRTGQVVQFHARDARAASDELSELLVRYRRERGGAAPAGALVYSCQGRGQGLYGVPDHDSRVIRQHLGQVPLGGFFCAGEIGPVHTRTFLHGYTASLALFRSSGWN